MCFPGNDIPSQESIDISFMVCQWLLVGLIFWWHYLNQRIYVYHPCLRFNLAYRFYAANSCFTQVVTKLVPFVAGIIIRCYPSPFSPAKGKEGYFVDGCKKVRTI